MFEMDTTARGPLADCAQAPMEARESTLRELAAETAENLGNANCIAYGLRQALLGLVKDAPCEPEKPPEGLKEMMKRNLLMARALRQTLAELEERL